MPVNASTSIGTSLTSASLNPIEHDRCLLTSVARASPSSVPIDGASFLQVRLAGAEGVPPPAAEVFHNERLKACRRPADEVQHGAVFYLDSLCPKIPPGFFLEFVGYIFHGLKDLSRLF